MQQLKINNWNTNVKCIDTQLLLFIYYLIFIIKVLCEYVKTKYKFDITINAFANDEHSWNYEFQDLFPNFAFSVGFLYFSKLKFVIPNWDHPKQIPNYEIVLQVREIQTWLIWCQLHSDFNSAD